jgi:Bacterial protein of unknown function (HtrL_YibB)
MAQDVTFVTAFYTIYKEPDEAYLKNFIRFAEKGASVILYLDEKCKNWAAKLAAYPKVQIKHHLQFADLPVTKLYPKSETGLPSAVHHLKDTYEYLVVMNSKLDFLTDAFKQTSTEKLIWIDFGIGKIIKDMDAAWTKLQNVQIPNDKIMLAGCYGVYDPNVEFNVYGTVHWRFCGGLIFGTRSTITKFNELNTKKLIELKPTNKITWEVNIWAVLERENRDFFQWYRGDHDDSIMNFPLPKRVMVVLMIKNESAIIKRCIEKALQIADAIYIADTGSTDGTVQLLCDLLPTLNIPAKMDGHEWKNFGQNRTLSFQGAVAFCDELNWEKELTYGLLLDADMNFALTNKFSKLDLVKNGYAIIQKNSHLEYYNTRFVKLGYPWKCVGVTHEYWDGADCGKMDTVYIDDIGDGGAKADKFERDARLLTEGLANEPTNVRYMFYLAQTLKDLKKIPESIAMYKRRVDAGGWFEEVWFSMYQISRLSYELNNLTEMEYWGLRAYDYHKERSENIYFLTRIFREKGQNFKAWHYMKMGMAIPKTKDQLFIETDVYDYLFKYEKTILNYYVEPHRRPEATKELIDYYNLQGGHCYGNLQHYVDPVKATYKSLDFKPIDDYVATSTSVLPQPNGYLLNVRYVNYRIQNDGSYMMYVDGNLSRDNPVRTRNFALRTDRDFVPLGPMEEMKPTFPSKNNVHIQGLEDLRIYQDTEGLKWVGTSMEYSYDGRIRQIMGKYNLKENTLTDAVSLVPPKKSDCEKNWIPLGNDEFIYGWHPYTIGKVEADTLVIKKTQATPKFFEHLRGSSNVVEYNGSLWAITHIVMYCMPRKYYHIVVRLNKETRNIEAYTNPFFFKTNHIEYVLGMDIRDNTIYATVSQNDMNPVLALIDMSSLRFHNL